jgi:D-cysteine desulfhydrase
MGLCPAPDVIVVAMGSCGTAAGLLVGLRLAGLKSRVMGVRAYSRPLTDAAQAARLANLTAAHLAFLGCPFAGRFRASDLLPAPVPSAPGRPLPWPVDPIYTSPAWRVAAGLGGPGVLYWHTLSSAPKEGLRKVALDALPSVLGDWARSGSSAEP